MSVLTSDAELIKLLKSVKSIAVVGISDSEDRPSYGVARYLREVGYEVIPVNPNLDKWEGLKAFPTVEAIGRHVDMVDVFRRPEALMDVVDDVLAADAGALWTQFGVVDANATDRAVAAGIPTVIDHCVKIEHRRLIAGRGA